VMTAQAGITGLVITWVKTFHRQQWNCQMMSSPLARVLVADACQSQSM